MKICRHTKKKIYATIEGTKWCSHCGAVMWRYSKKWEYPKFWKEKNETRTAT